MRCTISFDFDGVLAKSPFGRKVLYPVLEILAAEQASREGLDPGKAFEGLLGLLRREAARRSTRGRALAAYDWDDIAARLARRLRLTPPGDLTERTRAACRALTASAGDRSLLYPAARETLSALRRRGVRLLLLTNGFARYQLPFIEALGLNACFDEVFTSDRLGTIKPASRAFTRAFAAEGGAEVRKFHIGDRLIQDVSGARRAGVTAVWVHYQLTDELKRLPPAGRAVSEALRPVLLEQLRYEGWRGKLRKRFVPELVIADLSEIEPLLPPGC
jgi:putative hydrolase of the HAD superfamily